MAEQSIYKHMYKIDLNDQLKRRDVGILATHDSNANRFGAELTQGGTAFDASAYSVFGYFIRPNMETVLIEGTAEGNTVYVDLSANCYVYDGAFTLSVKIVKGDMTQTILLCDGHLAEARTGVIIDPEHVVPSLEEVLAKMAAVDSATQAANDAATEAVQIANAAAGTALAAAETANQAATSIDAKVAEANAELSGKVSELSALAEETKFNLFLGEHWEHGSYSGIDKFDGYIINDNNARLHCQIPVKNGGSFTLKSADGYDYEYAFFDADGNCLSYVSAWQSQEYTYTNDQIRYIRVDFRKNDNSVFANTINTLFYCYKNGIGSMDALRDNVDQKFDVNSLVIQESTSNRLDTTKYTKDMRITDVHPYFVDRVGCIISAPVNVDGVSTIAIRSHNASESIRWIACMTNVGMSAENVLAIISGFNTQEDVETDFVINLPSGTKWIYICLKAPSTSDDWESDTLAFGTVATSDPYRGNNAVAFVLKDGKEIRIRADLDVEKSVASEEYEGNRVLADFVPYSVGAPEGITFSKQYDRARIVWFSDSHIDLPRGTAYGLQNVKNTIAFANNRSVPFDAIIHTGDNISNSGRDTAETAKALQEPFFAELKKSKKPVVWVKGNHDCNDWGNVPANVLTDDDWSEIWYNHAENNMGIVRQTKSNGEKSTWHYIDLADQKIRIIGVDCQDTDKTVTDSSGNVLYNGGKAWYISQEQMDWIVNTALNFDDKSDKAWGVIVAIHQDVVFDTSLTPAYDSAIEKLFEICKAFNTQTTYADDYTFPTDSFFNLSINADFTRYAAQTNKPHMICWLIGHEHVDKHETVDGINKIWIANGSATAASSDSRVARVPGTATQNCFDLMSIDTVTRKIYIVRYGAGKNCFGEGGSRFLPDGLSY